MTLHLLTSTSCVLGTLRAQEVLVPAVFIHVRIAEFIQRGGQYRSRLRVGPCLWH